VAALARCCTLDVERAAKSLAHAKWPRIHTFIATSEIHLKYKLKEDRGAGAGGSREGRGAARQYADDVEFSAEDGARTTPEYLDRISLAVVAAGARTATFRTPWATRCRTSTAL